MQINEEWQQILDEMREQIPTLSVYEAREAIQYVKGRYFASTMFMVFFAVLLYWSFIVWIVYNPPRSIGEFRGYIAIGIIPAFYTLPLVQMIHPGSYHDKIKYKTVDYLKRIMKGKEEEDE